MLLEMDDAIPKPPCADANQFPILACSYSEFAIDSICWLNRVFSFRKTCTMPTKLEPKVAPERMLKAAPSDSAFSATTAGLFHRL
jgi:hypothetical protein